jgi:anti-anti-sigma factor
MPSEKPGNIAIGNHENLLVIKLAGRCTVTMSTCLSRLFDRCRRPQITDVYVDLSEVEYMDSTCVGLVVSLALKKNDTSVPRIHLLRPSSAVVRILETMLVLDHLECSDALPTAIAEWKELPVEATDQADLAAVMIDAHENLIKADARNVEVFGPVVDGLRADRRAEEAKVPARDRGPGGI